MSSTSTTPPLENKRRRFIFDLVFGVIAPIACLIFDPAVFKGERLLSTGGLLASFKVLAYSAVGLGVVLLAAWLLFRSRLRRWSGYLSGIFLMGQLAAFGLGTVLLPFSIAGIAMAGLGLLGFIPFITAFVFYRQRLAALGDSAGLAHPQRAALLGFAIVLVIPILLQWGTSRYVGGAVRDILNERDSAAQVAVSRLKLAFWCGDECFYELAWAYYKADKDPARRAYLAGIYRDITGGDIRDKTTSFSD
jgi:hypothetical protein